MLQLVCHGGCWIASAETVQAPSRDIFNDDVDLDALAFGV